MNINSVLPDDRCTNCGDVFANHDYVVNSIDKYKCPHPSCETTYGCFHGGDPRMFSPDVECCSKKELSNHERACECWNEAESRGEKPTPEKCPSGYIRNESGKVVAHVLRSPYGVGLYTVEYETTFEPRDTEDNYEGDLFDE